MARRCVGVDVNPTAIRMVALSWERDGTTLLHAAEAAWDGRSGWGSREQADALRDAVARLGWPPLRRLPAAVSLHDAGVVCRVMTLPRMPRAALRKAVLWEGPRQLAVALQDPFVDFDVVAETNEETTVLVGLGERARLDEAARAIRRAGLRVAVVEPAILAAHRAATGRRPAEGDGVVVLVEDEETQVAAFHLGAPAVSRTVSMGYRTFVRHVADALHFPPQQAEEALERWGFGAGTPLEPVLREALAGYVGEIARAIDFHLAERREARLAWVAALGRGAELRDFHAFLGEQLRASLGGRLRDRVTTDVRAWPAATGADEAARNGLSARFAVAYGLALRGSVR